MKIKFDQNKKIALFHIRVLLLGIFILYPLSSLAHGQSGFKAKFKTITLDKETIQTINLKTLKIQEKDMVETIKSTGQIEEIPENHFNINSPVQGTVTSVLVDLGSKIKAGQPVAIIESPEIAKIQAEVKRLKAKLELAQSNFEREKSLFDDGISSKKDFEASKAFLESMKANLSAAESNLKILTTHTASTEQGTFKIVARKSGTITERNITIGEVVVPSRILFKGIDLSNVWASANIYEQDINKISIGQAVNVTLHGALDKFYTGKITYVSPMVDKDSRTLPVKAKLHNSNGKLNPGSFITLSIFTSKKRKSIIIPLTALLDTDADKTDKDKIHPHIVYTKEENTFIPREILVVPHDSNNVEVISGLMTGNEIVTQGGYQLKFAEGEHDDSDKHAHEAHGYDHEGDEHEGEAHGHDNESDEHEHEAHGHDHESDEHEKKQHKSSFPIGITFGVFALALVAGILIGKKSSKK